MLCVLDACNSLPVGGNHSGIKTATRFCSVGAIGQSFTKICMSLTSHVIDAKEIEKF